ncbi:Hypothetical predicted protein [Scomber scombrus]|uniref:Uncharacterized protein n=1 Tax=Scomber scombrus TaxID=13677 RepID=A0AAV1NWH7_SCOSC
MAAWLACPVDTWHVGQLRWCSISVKLQLQYASLLREIFQSSSEAQNAGNAAVTSRKFGISEAYRESLKAKI